MRLIVAAAVALVLVDAAQQPPPTIRLTPGLIIDTSVRVQPGTYRLPSNAIDEPAIVIRGSGVTVDLTGVTIEGAEPYANPDTFAGTGLLVDGGQRVTVRGAAIRGYKVGILARRSPRLHLTGNDLSFNWKPQLKSGIEQEHLDDWLSFHDNEKDEWLRYGAAIYIAGSDDAEIDHNRAVQGMNGLMVTRSSRLKIWNNTFSWLSGLGIGFYRTTDSDVMHNRLDWCVRGYSHGFYNRGQDSAGLLLYEQSSRNVVAYNSITHGGDGVFLWAGQTTMDTGQGGSNDNLFFENDVSHAVANGIEATFSRNRFIANRIEDSWHGIWAGYSFDSHIFQNVFARNTEGIAIEHGQNIDIEQNRFSGDETAIRIWANTTQDPNWGYPKARDTRSRGYLIKENRFERVKTAVNVSRTSDIRLRGNGYQEVANQLQMGPDAPQDLANKDLPDSATVVYLDLPKPMADASDARLPAGARRGRETIVVDEWGPYDYLSPKLWPAGKPGERPLRLRVLGPAGKWTVASLRGASTRTKTGQVPGEIVLTPSGAGADLAVELSYVGGEVVTPRGQRVAAGQPYRFSYALFQPAIDWIVRFWKLEDRIDPVRNVNGLQALLARPPVRTEKGTRLAYANARAFGEGFTERIAVTAQGTVTLPAGSYELSVTSDDGIRVWVDDRLVLQDWSIHGAKEDRVPITGGRHRLRVEYFQNLGAAALLVQIVRP